MDAAKEESKKKEVINDNKDEDEAVEYTSEGEMDMNIEGSEEDQQKLLAVWNFLCEFKFEPEGYQYLFIMRVMNICQFNDDILDCRDAQIALLEYLKFLYLKGKYLYEGKDPDRLLPSPKMDLVWREQLLYTTTYLSLCQGIKKRLGLEVDHKIFHREYPRSIDPQDYAQRYAETVAEYRSVFGSPVTEWWPADAENDNSPDGYYNSMIWCVKSFHDKAEFVEGADVEEPQELKPLALNEAGKAATSCIKQRTSTGAEVAARIDAIEFPKNMAKTYQKETRLPMVTVMKMLYEYKKYLWLSYINPDVAVPSTPVDQLWHMHVTSTVNYDKEIKKVFGTFLHHNPGGGTQEEKEGFTAALEKSSDVFNTNFEEGVDTEAWPSIEIKKDKYQSLFAWRPRVKPN